MTRPARRCGDHGQPGCGAPIVLVRLHDLERPVPGDQRSWIPLEPDWDPDTSSVPPSHATNLSRPPTVARVLRRGEEPWPTERPALTHFAVCPLRTRPTEDPTP